jgi:hypothetical protein
MQIVRFQATNIYIYPLATRPTSFVQWQ